MIKAILVAATGNQTDDAVFTSALAVARVFNAHLGCLHVRVDAGAVAAAMATDGSGAAMVSGLVERINEEAARREDTARQLFQRFCERERLAIEDTPAGRQNPTAQWIRQTGDEAYWVREYGRAADLLVIGRPAGDQGVSIDTVEAALVGAGRPVLIVPAAPLVSLPETIVIAWKAAPEAARATTAAMPLLSKAKEILIATVSAGRCRYPARGCCRRRCPRCNGRVRPQPVARMDFRRLYRARAARRYGAGADDALGAAPTWARSRKKKLTRHFARVAALIYGNEPLPGRRQRPR
jgi:hypothetical protein